MPTCNFCGDDIRFCDDYETFEDTGNWYHKKCLKTFAKMYNCIVLLERNAYETGVPFNWKHQQKQQQPVITEF